MATVSVYTRITDANGKRQCALADPKKSYPAGTIFCLRYEVNGRRKLETLKCKGVTYRYALAIAKVRESELLTGAINAATNPPVVPVAAEPVKPARLTVDQAIDRHLRNASTKSPRTFHGYTYTMKQFRESCAKQLLDEISKQDRQGCRVLQCAGVPFNFSAIQGRNCARIGDHSRLHVAS